MDELKDVQAAYQKSKMSRSNMLVHAGSSTNFGSDGTRWPRGLGHSPTERVPLKTSKLVLPDLGNKISKNLPFGMGEKNNYDGISDVQHEADIRLAREFLESDLATVHKKKARARGINATIMTGNFKASDIERNSVLSYGKGTGAKIFGVHHNESPGLFKTPSSKNAFHKRNNSTIDGNITGLAKPRGMSSTRAQDL